LAGKSCDFAVIRALRVAGYDVQAVAELLRGSTDQAVLALASAGQRVLLTEDKDFGELVFAGAPASGVLLIRFLSDARSHLVDSIMEVIAEHGERLMELFLVVTPAGMRLSRLPHDER
jgi:predicted nuclease of predicted toxin-antitoxin system